MAYAPNAYSMTVREHIDTGERFHCVCEYSPCRCGDEYLTAGVIITTNAKRRHNAHTTVHGQWQYCGSLDCETCRIMVESVLAGVTNMVQISCFYVVSSEDDLIGQCATLQEATVLAAETLQDKTLQHYAPITVVLLDTSGTETRVLTIDLAK